MTASPLLRLPFFYGWLLVAIAFVTMGVGVTARTAFSLLFPPILDEFGWDRAATAGVFSFGFLVSAFLAPLSGWLMDHRGPRVVLELGIFVLALGLLAATAATAPWQLYMTLGVAVGSGSSLLGFSGQSLYLPRWFERRRGLAMSIAFSGVGVGSLLLPWLQSVLDAHGWRAVCWLLAGLMLVLVAPLNLLVRARPGDLGLRADGDAAPHDPVARHAANVVDRQWAAIDWTLARALRTARFWWIAAGFFLALYAWYAVQVHQTKYLVEIGFHPMTAAWALGLVSLVAIPSQIAFGHVSDRIGREWVWTIGCLGFAGCFLVLLLLRAMPTVPLLLVMVLAQGLVGYALTSVFPAIPAEIFESRHYGPIMGSLMSASILGGAAGPFVTGALFDATGSYDAGFWVAGAFSLLAIVAIWRAAPRKVRAVAGRIAHRSEA